eukprot:CAMPEP_0113418740 /NCGR_PEP_ID=MMETSP0013_2-20120614/26375_1 /TAXON_ID=2843 ORGANISM="Skeletonema costatum, Strain 1716" /NCGR_SAMPLE_ID=MMETSP0013_2 /ASSEMBLY_ACC=CAM_ASM_000158 /LENGTH=52 /DNA_ID=CAMNT_0000306011 /DNA_START=70 /DNA_END=224 /DNA_ORIENTATION=+ /assembly_acc=CAM_ASM_000158
MLSSAFRTISRPKHGLTATTTAARRTMATIDVTVREAINQGIDEEMERDEKV